MNQLEQLKRSTALYEPMDVITQCEIVGEAMATGAPYMENYEGLALFLGVSKNKVYQMKRIYDNMVDEAKEYFREADYQVHTAFLVSMMTEEKQLEWIKEKSFSTLQQ